VALLDALVDLKEAEGFVVVAAHLDHGLRLGSGDATFCDQLCARLGVPLRVGTADVRGRARRQGGGIEEAARIERYDFLRGVMREEHAVAIAVAHTRDDQAETLLMRLLRGAGSAGLGAMRAYSGDVVRPLLRASRAEVLEHLARRGLEWLEDPSNTDQALLRNRVRHELIPYLEGRFNPRIREALARSAGLLADEAEVLAEQASELLGRCHAAEGGGTIRLRCEPLRRAPRAVARAALRLAFERAGGLRGIAEIHVGRLLGLTCSNTASGRRLSLPGRREAVFSFDEVQIGPRRERQTPFAVPLPVPGRVEVPGGYTVSARPARGPEVSNEEQTVVVGAPEGGLTVRTRRPGDRVRSRGREVSLRRFLMAQRVPADQRGRLPLVVSGDRVLWVPGQPCEGGGESSRRFVRLEISESARS
jgi:tRNA(Ile)-lysidine synthase